MRFRTVLWVCLLLPVGRAPAEQKIVLQRLDARGAGADAVAERVSQAALARLAAVPGRQVSLVRPAPDASPDLRTLSAGALGRRLAQATSADLVLLGGVARLGGDPAEWLASWCGYRAADGTLLLADAVRGAARGDGSTREFEAAVAVQMARAPADWSLPSAEVATVQADGPRQVVEVRLDTPLAASRTGYALERLPPVVPSERTGEQFAVPAEPLGRGAMLRSEQGVTAFELRDAPLLTAGQQLRVAPLGELPEVPAGPGILVTSAPRGALVSLAGRLYGVTPLWLPLPVDGDAELQIDHPDRLPYRQLVGAAARAAGVVAVALLDPPPGEAAAAGEPAFDLRIESVPTSAEVSVDGKPQGLTPLRVAGLHGRPTVTVRRPGYKDWEAQLTANGSLSLQAQLVSMFGGLVVTSPRPGGRVLVDGKEQGATPLRLTGVAEGMHEVKLLAEGRPPEVRRVMVRAGQTVQVSFGAEPATVTGEGPRPGGNQPALPRREELRVGAVLWERKVDLLGPRGKPARIHLAIARLGEGCLFSATLAPPQAYETRPVAGALTCLWPSLRTTTARTWPTPEVGHITSVSLAPAAGAPGGLEVRVQPASGVTVKVHASSTLERVRLVLAR